MKRFWDELKILFLPSIAKAFLSRRTKYFSETSSDQTNWKKDKQAWILVPDIGECPAKNQVMSEESFFTTDTVVLCEAKKFIKVLKLRSIW